MSDPLAGRRTFPGGSVRLPRLDDPVPTEPAFAIVGTAFVRDDPDAAGAEGPTGFTGYFTYESLFEQPAEPDHVEALAEPYVILGVTPETPWDEVVHRHRQLVKDFHPDRFTHATPTERDEAEEQIRLVNVAFSELRRLHPEGG